MLALFLLLALLLVLVGHAFRLLRWEQFIRIYERPPRGQMLRGMAGGYALNFVLPFHLGDAFRAVYTGRRMKGLLRSGCWGWAARRWTARRGITLCSRCCWGWDWCWSWRCGIF